MLDTGTYAVRIMEEESGAIDPFHMEEYEKTVEIFDMFVEDWAEACEVNARLEAARNIKNRTISQCFLGAAVEKGYETYQL